MSVSWRRILERAGDDLAHEQALGALRPAENRGARRRPSWISQPADPIAGARDLLARELQAMSSPSSQYRESHYNPEGMPGQLEQKQSQLPARVKVQERAARRHWGRNLAAVIVSSTVICSTIYAFMQQWPSQANAAREAPYQHFSINEVRASAAHVPLDNGEAAGNKAQSRAGLTQPAAAEKLSQQPLTEQEEDVLLYRASNLLEAGDIAAARTIYQELASRGSQRGAVGIAETYDPNIVAKVLIKGLKADASAARSWYKRAAELGSKTAQERIKALDSSVN